MANIQSLIPIIANLGTQSVTIRREQRYRSKAKLERAAKECDRTLSAYIGGVLKGHIDRNPNGLQALEPQTPHESSEASHTEQEESTDNFVEEMFENLE